MPGLRGIPPARSMTFPMLPPTTQVSGPIISVHYHSTATDLLLAVGYILQAYEMAANMILPYALEQQNAEGNGKRIPTVTDSESWWRRKFERTSKPPQVDLDSLVRVGQPFYFTAWSHDAAGNRLLDFVVSCTGIKPVFIFTPWSQSELTQKVLGRRMSILAQRMKQVIPARRVFAFFGLASVVEALATAWSEEVDRAIQKPPLYDATYTFCTTRTLGEKPEFDPTHRLGIARQEHKEQVAILCKEFADDSAYPMSMKDAREEATELIERQQLYIYEAYNDETGTHEVASLVAVTRESHRVAAISKVFTAVEWRRRGFAERLVAYTCRHVLQVKQRVVLYVAHGNSAANVYGRVGFVGVGRRLFDEHLLVEHWLELGIEDTDPGHW